MVELQIKQRCEVQECLGQLQHSSSLQHQYRPLRLRSRCRNLKALYSKRHQHNNQHHTEPIAMVEALSSINTSVLRSPADDCHIPSCPTTQGASVITTPPIRSVKEAASKSRKNGKSRGTTASRLPTARLMRHSRRAKMRQREYRRLRRLLPSLQEKQEVSKVEVVAEAARYIDDLHERLIQRFKTKGLPQQLKDLPISVDDVHLGNIQDLVHHIMTVTNPASLPPTNIENTKQIPSFITKNTKHKCL